MLLGLIRWAPRTSEQNSSTILSERFEVWSLDAERRAGGRWATSRIKHTESRSQVLMKCTYPLMETSPSGLRHVLTIWREPCCKGEDVSLTLDWAFRNVLGAIVWARLTNGLLIQTHASSPVSSCVLLSNTGVGPGSPAHTHTHAAGLSAGFSCGVTVLHGDGGTMLVRRLK